MTRFGYTILYVRDVRCTIEFYENAFDFKRTYFSEEGAYAELATGETTLSFASIEQASSNLRAGFVQSTLEAKPFGIEIGITTDDVEATVARSIAAGALPLEAPKTKPWGQCVAYVRDPDGFLIEICTPMG